jgi:hypothetical protein
MTKMICQVEKKIDLSQKENSVSLPSDFRIIDIRICTLELETFLVISGETDLISKTSGYYIFEYLLVSEDGLIPSNYEVKKWFTFDKKSNIQILLYHLYQVISRPPHAHELMKNMRDSQS